MLNADFVRQVQSRIFSVKPTTIPACLKKQLHGNIHNVDILHKLPWCTMPWQIYTQELYTNIFQTGRWKRVPTFVEKIIVFLCKSCQTWVEVTRTLRAHLTSTWTTRTSPWRGKAKNAVWKHRCQRSKQMTRKITITHQDRYSSPKLHTQELHLAASRVVCYERCFTCSR